MRRRRYARRRRFPPRPGSPNPRRLGGEEAGLADQSNPRRLGGEEAGLADQSAERSELTR